MDALRKELAALRAEVAHAEDDARLAHAAMEIMRRERDAERDLVAQRDETVNALRARVKALEASVAELEGEAARMRPYIAPDGDPGIEAWGRCYKQQGDRLYAAEARLARAVELLRGVTDEMGEYCLDAEHGKEG